jgi:hypothetical protein
MKKIIIISLALTLAACVSTKPPMYYWGDYSETLYEYKSEPSEETLIEHYESIQDIFNKSQEMGIRVPPGVYAEYATLRLKEGKRAEALKYYRLEKITYPESTMLMDRMIKTVGEE